MSLPIFHMSKYHGSPRDHVPYGHLVEHPPSIFHLAYMSTRLVPVQTSNLQPLCMICWWAHLLSSNANTLAHAFSIPTKVIGSGFTQSSSICQNSSYAFYSCPHFTCRDIITFQDTTSLVGMLLKTGHASSMLHIWHTCPWDYSQQTHWTHNHFEWYVHEHACHLLVLAISTYIQDRNKSECVTNHAFFLHLLEEFQCFLVLFSLDILCKPSIPWKTVQL